MLFADARLGDDADVGQLLEEMEREAGVRRATAALEGYGATECARCGDTIEPARLAAFPAAIRCIDCQTLFERAGSRSPAGPRIAGKPSSSAPGAADCQQLHERATRS